MKQIQMNGLKLWQFESLGKEPLIKHFVTDRNALKHEKEFTLSLSSSPDKSEILNNRSLLAKALAIPPSQLYFPHQIHKTKIVTVTHNTNADELIDTDALITQEKNICITALSADCVTILLYDRKNKAIAAVHSGWRGTVSKILEKTLLEMNRKFNTTEKDLIACIGPSVCQDSYEVGEEVVQEINHAFGSKCGLLISQPNGKAKLDLWKANKIQLMEFGVPSSCIEISDLCTVKNNNHFFSARKGDAGRFSAGIMLV